MMTQQYFNPGKSFLPEVGQPEEGMLDFFYTPQAEGVANQDMSNNPFSLSFAGIPGMGGDDLGGGFLGNINDFIGGDTFKNLTGLGSTAIAGINAWGKMQANEQNKEQFEFQKDAYNQQYADSRSDRTQHREDLAISRPGYRGAA